MFWSGWKVWESGLNRTILTSSGRRWEGKWNLTEGVFMWVLFSSPFPSSLFFSIYLQKITGPHLLLLNEKALEAIGVHSEYRRQTILQAIEELRVKEYSVPRNLYEFKVHRVVVLCCILLYSSYLMLLYSDNVLATALAWISQQSWVIALCSQACLWSRVHDEVISIKAMSSCALIIQQNLPPGCPQETDSSGHCLLHRLWPAGLYLHIPLFLLWDLPAIAAVSLAFHRGQKGAKWTSDLGEWNREELWCWGAHWGAHWGGYTKEGKDVKKVNMHTLHIHTHTHTHTPETRAHTPPTICLCTGGATHPPLPCGWVCLELVWSPSLDLFSHYDPLLLGHCTGGEGHCHSAK